MSDSTVELTSDNFEEIVTTNPIVLIDFWAGWCGPCRQFAPVFESAAAAHPDIVFGKVDTEAQGELAAMAQISSIPTLMAFRDQVLVFAQPGALPAPALEEVIAGVRGLDMDDVRRQLAQASNLDEVDLDTFVAEHASDAFVLDVREPDEYAAGHVSGAVLIPLGELMARVGEIPTDRPVYVICRSGNRSGQAATALRAQGVHAINVAGGTQGWADRGWPLDR